MSDVLYAALEAGPKSKRERYEQLRGRLWAERATFDADWQEIGNFMLPRRTRFWPGDRNRGGRRNQNIIDSTGRFAARTLSSGMHAGLTSPARPWMKLSTPDPDLAEFGPVKTWLHTVTQRMLTIFVQSNLYNALPIVYLDIGTFGTSAMAVVEDSQELLRVYPYPLGSYALGMNARGTATTFIRDYELTVLQVVETFGVRQGYRDIDWSVMSTIVKSMWDRGDYEAPVQVTWVVCPNRDADPNKMGAKFLPWTSCHYERGEARDNRFLRESGFRTFPIMAPRWDVTSSEDTYGDDCPGITVVGDVKQLQVMQRKKAQAIAKIVDPPLVGPNSLRTQKTSLIPGDITYLDVRENQMGLRAVHEINLNLEHLILDMRDVQQRIRTGFYADLFLMMTEADRMGGTQPETARAIEERHEEKLLALGPTLERTGDELLDPLVDRAYSLMEASGMVPEPPEELRDQRLKIEYTSILAQAQKLVGVVGQDRFLSTMLPMLEPFPEVRNKIVIYQVVDDYAEMLGIDPRIVRETKDAEAIANQQAQAAQEQQQAQQAMMLAKAAKDASGADMSKDTALSRIVGNAAKV